jgi:thiamine pyrophosphokinase
MFIAISIRSDVIYLLHELVHQPRGNMELSEMRKKHVSWLTSDPRVVLMYCAQKSFISLVHNTIQLTVLGLRYYLANFKCLF